MRKFRTEKRSNYMSIQDAAQDFTTEYLLSKIPSLDSMKVAKAYLSELESRIDVELTEEEYFEALDKCNPVY